jgi:hypothetical protein
MPRGMSRASALCKGSRRITEVITCEHQENVPIDCQLGFHVVKCRTCYDDLWCRCRFDWSYWLEIGAMSILVICAPWCKEVAKLGVCMHSCPYVSIIYLHNYTDSGIPDDGHSTSLLRNTNKIGLRGKVMWHAIWVCLRIGAICAQRKIYT